MKKSIQIISFAALIFVFAGFAIGQIKIPKIFKPKTEQTPPNPTPQNSAPLSNQRQTADKSPSEAMAGATYLDDGFTWFESVWTEVLNEKQAGVPTGWTLNSSVRLMGVYPKRSAFKFVVSRGGKVLGTTRCEASTYNIPADNPADVSFAYVNGCFDRAAATKEIGKFDVEVIAVNGATNAETSVRKYKIEVFKVDRVKDQIGKFAGPEPPRYVISRYAESPVSVLFLRPAQAYGYVFEGERSTYNQVEIHYSVSPFKDINSLHATLRCSVDGKLCNFPATVIRRI